MPTADTNAAPVAGRPSDPPPAAPDLAAPDLAALLDRMGDGFLALDADWRITYLNEAAARLFWRDRDGLRGKRVWEEFPEGVGTEIYHAYQRAARTQTPAQIESFSAPHGRWFECHIHPSPEGLTVFFRDVTERRETRRRLEVNEQRYRSLFEQNADAVFTLDAEGRFADTNPACEAVSGYSPAEMRGAHFLPLVAPEHRDRTLEITAQALRGTPQHEEIAILHKSGRRVDLALTKVPVVVDGAVVGAYGIAKDITARKAAEAALREGETWLHAVAEAAPVPMTITRWSDGTVFFANRHVRDLFGVPPDQEIVGRSTERFFAAPADRERLIGTLTERGHVRDWECRVRRADGTPFWASGSFQRLLFRGEEAILSVYHDVSERRRLLDEARAEADRDPLTGLLNHRAFQKRLEEAADRARAGGAPLAVAVLDLDNFKFFNDAYGHATGDEVLRRVADVLRAARRDGDALARFGGDEFALLMPGAGADAEGGTGAEAVRARLAARLGGVSYRPPGHDAPLPISLSVGVALFPAEADTRLGVVQLADERLRRAKSGGGGGAQAQRVREAARGAVRGFPMLDALVTAVDAKDRYTRRHSEDVLTHSLQTARALGLDADARRTLEVAALLHDVGKIGVPDAVLRKPGRLTEEEFEAVKQHPAMGAAIAAAVPGLEKTLGAIRHHHERWDGGGYPDGLAGAQIPLLARILAVADAYSAMTTDRPYRRGRADAEARAILAAGAGTQWDAACVSALLAAAPGWAPGPGTAESPASGST